MERKSLDIREIQIKATMKYYLTSINKKKWKINGDEDMEKLELFYIADGNAPWCSCYGKQFDSPSKC